MKYEEASLEALNYLELNIMLEHVRLGEKHLKKYLNEKQFSDLLQWGDLKKTQKENIVSNKSEKAGNVATILNAIFTSLFGSWMGLSSYVGFHLGSLLALLSILSVATLSSGFLGYYAFKLTKTQVKEAIIKQKLHNLQLALLKQINKLRDTNIDTVITYLNTTLIRLDAETKIFDDKNRILLKKNFSKEDMDKWLSALNDVLKGNIKKIRNEPISEIYLSEIIKTKNKFKKIYEKNIALKANTEPNKNKLGDRVLYRSSSAAFEDILTDPTIAIPKISVIKRSWLQDNYLSLLVGLIPTLLGGFSSMFVFLGGIPNIANAFGLEAIADIFTRPTSQAIGLGVALLLTLYFGFSHINSNYKSMKRRRELEVTQQHITNEETSVIELNSKFNMLTKIKSHMNRIVSISQVIKRLSKYIEERDKMFNEYKRVVKLLEQKINATEIAYSHDNT